MSFASSGTEGAAFLDIPVGGGPAALGSAYSALATNAYAPVWNPAGLGFVRATELAGQHLSYLESIHYEFAGIALPLGAKDSFGQATKSLAASMQYLGSGDIAGTDTTGMPIGDFSVHYAAYSLAYGQRLNDKLALGVTGKMINAKIADISANAYAADFGALYKPSDKLNLAATVVNAGSKLKFNNQSDSLPLAAHLAVAYQPEHHSLIALEGIQRINGQIQGRVGVEWRPINMIAIRAGYKTDTTKELSPLAGLTTGIGLNLWGQEFAYAWLPYGDLGDTQYFSLLLRFGEKDQEKRNLIQYQTIKRHRTAGTRGAKDVLTRDPEFQQLMQLLDDDATHLTYRASSLKK